MADLGSRAFGGSVGKKPQGVPWVRAYSAGLVSLALLGCGGSGDKPRTAADQTAAPASEPKETEIATAAAASSSAPVPHAVPDTCANPSGECLPSAAWVQKLCANVFPEVALYMFRQGTPWQRLYMRGRTPAANASGGASTGGFLEFDEEVLVLRHRAADAKGIQIGSGDGQYDALRWDGSCVSLEGGEVTTRLPPKAKHSRIEWRWIGDKMRDVLTNDTGLSDALRARQKECKGATSGDVSKKCVQLDEKLIALVAAYVRTHSELPQPTEQP